jgi:hypothetical protein
VLDPRTARLATVAPEAAAMEATSHTVRLAHPILGAAVVGLGAITTAAPPQVVAQAARAS